jgi:hypothetical protein
LLKIVRGVIGRHSIHGAMVYSVNGHGLGECMAETKLEIEKRCDRIELAINTMVHWLVQADIGFDKDRVEVIETILRGDKPNAGA